MTGQRRELALPCLAILLLVGVLVRPALAQQPSSVDYRLLEWKTAHLHDPAQAKLIHDALKSLECEVQQHSHGDHIDLSYRCLRWRRLTLASDELAHQWQHWLRLQGFQTRHEH
jgi:hypothetical protein